MCASWCRWAVSLKYDLKGRKSKHKDHPPEIKDNVSISHIHVCCYRIPMTEFFTMQVIKDNQLTRKFYPDKAQSLIDILVKDAEFLREQHCIDYSLLIGVHKASLQAETDMCWPPQVLSSFKIEVVHFSGCDQQVSKALSLNEKRHLLLRPDSIPVRPSEGKTPLHGNIPVKASSVDSNTGLEELETRFACRSQEASTDTVADRCVHGDVREKMLRAEITRSRSKPQRAYSFIVVSNQSCIFLCTATIWS